MSPITNNLRAAGTFFTQLKPRIRDAAAFVAARSRLTDPQIWAKSRLTIVTFHRVLRASERRHYPFSGLAVTPEELNRFLSYFTERYECGTLAKSIERWVSGNAGNLPLLAITFDDGQRDNYENARPILNHFNVCATFFIVPATNIETTSLLWHDRLGFAAKQLMTQPGGYEKLNEVFSLRPSSERSAGIGKLVQSAKEMPLQLRERRIREIEDNVENYQVPDWAGMMSWDDLADLIADGHEIGSHSCTHPILTQCSDDELEAELRESREMIAKRLRIKAISFCYPNGSYNDRVALAVEAAGYQCAVTTDFGTNDRGRSLYELRRCDMHPVYACSRHGKFSEARLALRMSGLQPGLFS